MLGLLVFKLNDLLYFHGDNKFFKHLRNIVKSEENNATIHKYNKLKKENSEQEAFVKDRIIQLFSPVITSYFLMNNHFHSSYKSITCGDVVIIFKEVNNFIFGRISEFLFISLGENEDFLEHFISIFVQITKACVGPCFNLLQLNVTIRTTIDNLISMWLKLYHSDQSYLVEAIHTYNINSQISSQSTKTLAALVEKVKCKKYIMSAHGLLFYNNKLISSYSSKNADELNISDILVLNIFKEMVKYENKNLKQDDNFEEYSPVMLSANLMTVLDRKNISNDFYEIKEFNLLLKTKFSDLSPHIIYIKNINNYMSLILVTELNRSQLSGQIIDLLTYFEDLKKEKLQIRDVSYIQFVDTFIKNSKDFILELPDYAVNEVENEFDKVYLNWKLLKENGLADWLQNTLLPMSPEIESGAETIIEYLRSTWKCVCLNLSLKFGAENINLSHRAEIESLAVLFEDELNLNVEKVSLPFNDFAISKYMEEFSGLVHFIYIDRNSHQLICPDLKNSYDDDEENSKVNQLTKSKIWSMVNFARSHLSIGHSSILWKDRTFSYSYFLWFEDQKGNSINPTIPLKEVCDAGPKDFSIPGIICGDFYKSLLEKSFTGTSKQLTRCYELFCIHLGMITNSCVLEQTRRLAATVCEVSASSQCLNTSELL